jgi:hypothetical protein
MAPILNLPLGFGMASLHFGGTGLPNGATVTFGFFADPAGPTPAAAGATIVSTLRAAGAPLVLTNTNFSNSCNFNDVLVKYGPLDSGPAATVAAGGVMGNTGGDAATPATSLLVNKSSLSGGRRGRGRMFFPGLSESNVGNGGFVTAGVVTALQTAFTQWFNAMNTAGLGLVLLHRYDPALGQTPQTPSTCTGLQVQALVATQRQRMRR